MAQIFVSHSGNSFRPSTYGKCGGGGIEQPEWQGWVE